MKFKESEIECNKHFYFFYNHQDDLKFNNNEHLFQ